jgi:hypothetical protein
MKSRKHISKGLICKLLSITLLSITQQSLAQGDLGFRFIHASIGIRNLAPNYGPIYAGAAADFAAFTSLSFFWSANQTLNPPYTGDVAFSEANYGATGWNAIADPYNQAGQGCFDASGQLTGNCNFANGADFGWVRFNTFYLPNPTNAQRNHLIRHEFSHILGLAHSGCYPATGVMAPGVGCVPLFSTLQAVEGGILGNWY